MTSQPSQSALDAETEAGIRARDAEAFFPEHGASRQTARDRRVLLAEIDRLRSAIEAIHFRVSGYPDNYEPEPFCSGDGQDWPCQTIRALQAAGGSPSTAEETPR